MFHIHTNTRMGRSDNGRVRVWRFTRWAGRRFKPDEIARFLAESNAHGDDGQQAENRQ